MKRVLILSALLTGLAVVTVQAEDAKALYDKDCKKCHGADGKGDTMMGKKNGCKDYTDAKVQAAMKDEDAIKAMKQGVKDKDGKVVMKPSEGLTDEQMKALVAYMRTFKK